MKKCLAGADHVPGPLGQPIRGGFIHAVGFVRSRDVRKGFSIRRDGVQTLRMLFRVAARTLGSSGWANRGPSRLFGSRNGLLSPRGDDPCPLRYSPGSSASRETTGACAQAESGEGRGMFHRRPNIGSVKRDRYSRVAAPVVTEGLRYAVAVKPV